MLILKKTAPTGNDVNGVETKQILDVKAIYASIQDKWGGKSPYDTATTTRGYFNVSTPTHTHTHAYTPPTFPHLHVRIPPVKLVVVF